MTERVPPAAGDLGARRVQEVAMGYYSSQALYVAAKLGVADLLDAGPLSAEELAAELGADAGSLHRTLRLLAKEGIFELDEAGRFSLNPAGAELKSAASGSMRDLVEVFGEEFYQAFGELIVAVRTGRDAFRLTFGRGLFEYLQKYPDRGRVFGRAMGAGAVFFSEVPAAYDFSSAGTVVDVGGGNGTLLGAILAAHPHLKGIVYDTGTVIESAEDNLRAQGVLDRSGTVAGNFFNEIVPGGDLYLFARILHDWTDEQCLTILGNCRRAIIPGGRVLLVERLLPGAYATAADVNMLAVTGGRERSEEEFGRLMSQTGFRLRQVVPLPLEYNLIEGVAV